MKRIVASFLIIILIMFFTAGCSRSEEEVVPPVQEEELGLGQYYEPREGGSIALQLHKSETLCPIHIKNQSNTHILNLIYERLFYCESNMTPSPCLARSYEVSSNAMVWTVFLKENIAWHDGTFFTAEDVEYTINQIKADGRDNQYYQCVDNISKIKIIDNSIEFTLLKPRSNFANLLYFPIIKKQNQKIDKKQFVPIGTGAFVYNSPTDNNGFVLTKNSNWHNGRIYLDEVRITFIPDNKNTSVFSFSSKDTDMLINNDVNWGKNINTAEINFADFGTGKFNFLGFNIRNPILGMPSVRQAISYGINNQKIVENILYGHGTVSWSPVSPTWKYFDSSIAAPSYDAQRGRQILIEDGWQLQNEVFEKKIANKTLRLQFDLLINDDNPVREQVAAFLQKNLMDLGVVINIKKVSFNEYTSLISNRRYDMFLGEYDILPDLNLSFMLNSYSNVFGFRDTEMDSILNRTQTETASEGVLNAYSELQKRFYDQLPCVGLYFRNSALLYNKRIKGMPKPLFCDAYRGIESLYIVE